MSESRVSPSEPLGADRPTGRRRSDRVVAASDSSRQTVEEASTAARSNLPVVIRGPAGSGRQHIARAIHAWSARAAEPFVALSVGGILEAAHERELAGTSDSSEPLLSGSHAGAVERAGGGTLYIAGLRQISASARSALLGGLRDGSVRRADGGSIALEARVILAIEDAEEPALGDLQHHVVSLSALTERPEDILPLATHFLAQVAESDGVPAVGFTSDARRWLLDEPWPGNVRELRERVRSAVRLAGNGALSAEALLLAAEGDVVPSFKEAKRAFETRYVEGLLRRCSGNISRAARLAKKDRKDFYDVIRRTGVDPGQFRS